MSATDKQPRVSKEEWKAQKREEQREMLAQAVEQLTTSDGWLRYLETRAKFHNYSFNNTILIALQKPEATQVAGAKKWANEFNRLITKGEKAIKILAPSPVYQKDEAGKPVLDDQGKKVLKFMWYRTVPVFDISQTEGDPVPEMPMEPLTGESHEEYLYRAEQFAKGIGVTVRYETWVGKSMGGEERRGYYTPKSKEIVVNDGLAINSQVRTMIHELCHAYGDVDYTNYSRNEAEVIVESAAYMICQSVGLDTTGMSVPYIASWAQEENEKDRVKALRDFAAKIDELAEAITEGIS